MHEKAPRPVSEAEHRARFARVNVIARGFGFVGVVEYRHVATMSGGAQYGMGHAIKQDVLLVYPEAFRRDADPDDFSLEAIIAHERGHQLLCRHERLRRNLPKEMSAVTEEVLASLLGSILVEDADDSEFLVAKGMTELLDRGMPLEQVSKRIYELRDYLERIL